MHPSNNTHTSTTHTHACMLMDAHTDIHKIQSIYLVDSLK